MSFIEVPSPTAAPSATVVAGLISEWIGKAQQGVSPGVCTEEKVLERIKHLFGVLSVVPKRGGSSLPLQVFVQLTQFQKLRFIFLHFYPSTDRDVERGTIARLPLTDRKEAGFVYFEAGTGALHGIHIAADQRGCGLSKPIVLYYVRFCGHFALAANETAHNRKPLFAKLYAELGYQPRSQSFPFLLLYRLPRGEDVLDTSQPEQPEPQQPQTQQPQHDEPRSYVLPLAATNPRKSAPSGCRAAARDPPVLDENDRAALQRLRLPEPPTTLEALQRAWKVRLDEITERAPPGRRASIVAVQPKKIARHPVRPLRLASAAQLTRRKRSCLP